MLCILQDFIAHRNEDPVVPSGLDAMRAGEPAKAWEDEGRPL